MKILHIDSSITGAASVSRTLTQEIVDTLRANAPAATVTYRDLALDPLPLMAGPLLGAMQDPTDRPETRQLRQVQQEFLDADVVVIGVPMYSFGIPAQLKIWIDYLAQAGVTFAYTTEGPTGLAGGHRVIVASSRGGLYGAGMPAAAFEHQESYVLGVLGFFGITDLEIIRAEGMAMGPDAAAVAMDSARAAIRALTVQKADALVD